VGRGWAAMRITQRTLAAMKTTNPKGTRYYDSELRGFCVRVMLDGAKHFEVRFGGRKSRRRLTIGRYGTVTLDQARTKARSLLARAALGEVPERRRNQSTFASWRATYLSRIRGRLKTAAKIQSFLSATDRWDSRGLDTITTSDVEALFQKLGEKHPTAANRFLQSLSPLFVAAVRDGLISVNPAAGIRHFRESPPRARVLSGDELRALLDAVAAEEDVHVRAAFMLLVETGARLSEVLRAKWADVDLDAGLWRLPSPKSGHPQMIPLARASVAHLRRLPHVGPFIVAGRGDAPRFDLKRPWERLRTAAKLPADVHVHDVRRTFGLAIARSAGLHVAQKLLRHSSVNVTERVYAPLGLEELRRATEVHSVAIPFRKGS
jgi:integrase